MSNYILLPTAGDPFIFRYWLHFYDKNIAGRPWQLCVGQFGEVDPDAIQAIQDLCDERGAFFKPSSGKGLPCCCEMSYENAHRLIEKAKEGEFIFICHTDCFVFSNTILDRYLDILSQGQTKLIGEYKGGYTTFDSGNPLNKEAKYSEILWPSWIFCPLAKWQKAYEILGEDVEKSGVSLSQIHGTVFSPYKGNEEMVAFLYILQSLFSESEKLRLGQPRGEPQAIESAKTKYEWFHCGTLEQLPINAFRDSNNIPLIKPPNTSTIYQERASGWNTYDSRSGLPPVLGS